MDKVEVPDLAPPKLPKPVAAKPKPKPTDGWQTVGFSEGALNVTSSRKVETRFRGNMTDQWSYATVSESFLALAWMSRNDSTPVSYISSDEKLVSDFAFIFNVKPSPSFHWRPAKEKAETYPVEKPKVERVWHELSKHTCPTRCLSSSVSVDTRYRAGKSDAWQKVRVAEKFMAQVWRNPLDFYYIELESAEKQFVAFVKDYLLKCTHARTHAQPTEASLEWSEALAGNWNDAREQLPGINMVVEVTYEEAKGWDLTIEPAEDFIYLFESGLYGPGKDTVVYWREWVPPTP